MTDTPTPPPPPPPGGPPPRLLRRSSQDRVAAGVCGGLGEYFAVDPVIFRVLFAVTSFLGAGILAYLVAWVAIPEQGAVDTPIDRFIGEMRRRGIPVWVVVAVAAVLGWAGLFSWWSPWPFFPVLVVAVLLIVVLSRRDASAGGPPAGYPPSPTSYPQSPQSPQSPQGPQRGVAYEMAQPASARAGFAAWLDESHARTRARLRRTAPVRWATLGTLAATLLVLGICDAVGGIVFPAYFWAVHVVVITGLIVGLLLRRTPWTLAFLLIPAAIGTFVFAGTHVSLHDGSGDNTITPTSVTALQPEYRQAFGRTTLDLRDVSTVDGKHTVLVRQAAGQVRVIVPRSLPVVVHGDIHLGDIEVDGHETHGGYDFSRDVVTGLVASGDLLTIGVDISAGQLRVDRTP